MRSSCSKTAVLARVALLVLACVPVACELMKYSPHEGDLPSSASQVNRKNIDRLLATPPGDTVRIAFVTDTQNYYDESQSFVDTINACGDIDFVVHGGDITNFGVLQEYEWMHEIFSELDVPYLAVIGNHDLLANGGDLYDSVYGRRDFSFVYARTKYVFVDTNSRQYGYPGDVPDLRWLRDQLAPGEDFDRAIVIGHVPPDHASFDDPLEQRFADILEQSDVVRLALYGHKHKYSVKTPYGEVIHLVTASAGEREYTLVSISDDGIAHQRVDF